MSQNDASPKARVIRDQGFAKRLETAVYNHPQAPDGHGRQKWLRERIESRFNTKLSPEAVRKWFSGESRPKPDLVHQMAQVLDVDEAWLSLGIKPDTTPAQKRQLNATATGAVNLVAGLIQMSGWHIAFPDEPTETVDLYAIIGGKQHSILVRTAQSSHPTLHKVIVPAGHEKSVVLLVMNPSPTEFTVLRLTKDTIANGGVNKGGFVELEVRQNGQTYSANGGPLPVIVSFDNLDGEKPISKKL